MSITPTPNPDQPAIDAMVAKLDTANGTLGTIKTEVAALIAKQQVNPTAPLDLSALTAAVGLTSDDATAIAGEIPTQTTPPAA